MLYKKNVDQDSSVGIATRYALNGPGIESWWWARFSAAVQTGPGVHPASFIKGTVSFLGVKQPGRVLDHPTTSSAEVKERVDLYLNSPCGSSWSVIGLTSHFTFSCKKNSYVYCFALGTE